MTREQSHTSEAQHVEPAIQSMIDSMLERYSSLLKGEDLEHFRQAEDEGDRIDIICYTLGAAQEIEASAKLKALRYVRKFSRQLHGAPLEDRAFDYPLISNHDYWAKVDGHFMGLLELQTRNQGGEFFGDPSFSELQHCRTDYFRVASTPHADILKSAVVLEGEPIHVFYLAQAPSRD